MLNERMEKIQSIGQWLVVCQVVEEIVKVDSVCKSYDHCNWSSQMALPCCPDGDVEVVLQMKYGDMQYGVIEQW